MSKFLSIAGLAGDSFDAKHKGWYGVENFQFSVNVPEGAKAQFSTVAIDFSSDAALTKMMDLLATGKVVPGMTLETTDPLNNKIYTLDLANAQISGIVDLPFGGFSVEISYTNIEVETRFQDPAGSFYGEDPFRWNIPGGKEGTALGPFTPAAGSTAAANADQYFLLIDGLNGGSANKGYEGWFNIEDFNFGALAPPGSKASFSDVTVAVTGDTGLTALQLLAAQGKIIKGARIEGVDVGGGGSTPVYDLTIGNIRITEISDLGIDGQAEGFNITFGYSLVETKVFDSVTSTFMTSSYDLTKATSGVTMPTIAVSSTQSPTDMATRFFLAIPGVQGDSLDKSHAGWIEVENVSYDISVSPGGKSQFSLVTLELSTDTPITGLLPLVTMGKVSAGATIHGINGLDDTVFELNLGDVMVSSLSENQNGLLEIKLAYDQVEVGTKGTLGNGTLVTNPIFGWDLTKNATTNVSEVGPGAKAPGVATTDYFMLIDGLSGGSADAKHKNWFDISDFSFNVDNSAAPGGVGIGGAGNPQFSGLSVHVGSQAALTNLLGYAANGKVLPGIKIEGVVFDGSGLAPTYDLSLAGVTVKSIQEDFGSGYFVEFGFEQIKLETKGVGDPTTDVASWNLSKQATGVSIPTLTPADASSWAAGASDFFMTFSGLKGESASQKNKGWFDIDSFFFGIETPSGGKAQFDTLTVNFTSEAGLANFASAISKGTLFQGATLRGMNSLGALSYNLDLSSAAIVGLSEGAGDGFSLQLAFDAFDLTQYKYSSTGVYTGGEGFGWDLVKNSSATVASVAPAGSLNYAAPSDFFMLVEGLNGGGTDVSHGNWFDVASFSLGVAQPGYVAGGKFGVVEYSGIDIAVTGQHGFTQFMELAATGKLLEGLVIEGVNGAAKGAGGAVYELVLGDIVVTNVTEFGAGYSLHLEFAKIEIMTKLADGSVASDFKWDLAANKAGGSMPDVNPLSSDRSETLAGAFGNSTLFGLGGNDIISGMDGNDFIDGGAGNDKMFGGNGFDIVSYATAAAGVTVNMLTTLQQDTKGSGLDSLSGFEELRGSAFNDRLTGNTSGNTLDGGDGNDILDGRGGIDTMRGGKGEDTFFVDNAGDFVIENAGEGIKDAIFASADFDLDTAPNVENLFAATTAITGLKLGGSAGDNSIRGSGFKDALFGDGGNDVLNGGLDADLMIGGLGNDIFYVDNVLDIVQEAIGQGTTDSVFASVNFTLGAGQEIDYLNANAGLTGLTLTGNELTNRIRGSNGGNDVLDGGAAGDLLYGQAGDDRLAGGLGVDSIYGGTGKDTFVLRNSSLDRDVLLDYVAADDTLEVSAALFGGGLKIGALGAGQFLSNLDGDVKNGGSASTRFIYDSDSGLLYFDADGTGAVGRVLIAQLPSLPSLVFDDILVVA